MSMHWTVKTWEEFKDAWDGVHNFLMTGEAVPFAFPMPPLERVVEEMRNDPEARFGPGTRASAIIEPTDGAEFKAMPVDQALATPFSLSHFKLSNFDAPGKFLHGFKDGVLDPWRNALAANGFTWERCYPIIFISGIDCTTNYHMDFSHVLAWQIYGNKRFCGLKSPGRWAPRRARVNYKSYEFTKPDALTPDDALCYDMKPGDVLWNALLTPHWVDASAGVAMSVNISHGGLRLNGKLCPFEQELEDHRAASPETAPGKLVAEY